MLTKSSNRNIFSELKMANSKVTKQQTKKSSKPKTSKSPAAKATEKKTQQINAAEKKKEKAKKISKSEVITLAVMSKLRLNDLGHENQIQDLLDNLKTGFRAVGYNPSSFKKDKKSEYPSDYQPFSKLVAFYRFSPAGS